MCATDLMTSHAWLKSKSRPHRFARVHGKFSKLLKKCLRTPKSARQMRKATVYVYDLDFFAIVRIFDDTLAALLLGNSAKITDIQIGGPVVKNHILSKMAENTNATRKTKYRALQDTADDSSSSPATTRRRSTSSSSLGSQSRDPTETQNKNKSSPPYRYRQICREICQSGWWSSQKI